MRWRYSTRMFDFDLDWYDEAACRAPVEIDGRTLDRDAVNRLFSNANPLLMAARGLGMRMVGALAGPRRAFIREAAGLSGEVPRLLTGQRL